VMSQARYVLAASTWSGPNC